MRTSTHEIYDMADLCTMHNVDRDRYQGLLIRRAEASQATGSLLTNRARIGGSQFHGVTEDQVKGGDDGCGGVRKGGVRETPDSGDVVGHTEPVCLD